MRVPTCLALAVVSLAGLTAGPAALADGHCTYTQQVTHGTHQVCEMPIAAAADCAALENQTSIVDSEFAGGACPTDDVVGTCDKGVTQIVYYSGDPTKLKTGCGFQGGTWLNGYAQP
jgi:hypothetical protein